MNVTQGMRRARKEGRYIGRAQVGYDNKIREDGSKHIVINQIEAGFIKWIFETIAEGIFVPDQIRKMANEQGFLVSRGNFYREIRNLVLTVCSKVLRLQAVNINESLPLQGILECDKCSKSLTSSASKGKKGGYCYYYHSQASFVDSTPIKVCHNNRIKRNKVFKDIAEVGKFTMDWFYGSKLHIVINDKGEILNYAITQANVDDRKPLKMNLF